MLWTCVFHAHRATTLSLGVIDNSLVPFKTKILLLDWATLTCCSVVFNGQNMYPLQPLQHVRTLGIEVSLLMFAITQLSDGACKNLLIMWCVGGPAAFCHICLSQ